MSVAGVEYDAYFLRLWRRPAKAAGFVALHPVQFMTGGIAKSDCCAFCLAAAGEKAIAGNRSALGRSENLQPVREGRVGVWVDQTQPGGPLREDKIAAIGVRLKRWVSLHGISLNVEPDLAHFTGITPCGIADERYGVTSLAGLGRVVTMAEADMALKAAFEDVFGSGLVRVDAPELLAG